jgi:ribosomal protein S18 acetylase RimI-like enzyme
MDERSKAEMNSEHMVVVERATPADAPAILALQRLAYRGEAELYREPALPPLTQTLDALLQEFDDHVILKAMLAGEMVGSVRGHQLANSWQIGRLAVHPAHQNRGIGSLLMEAIEQLSPAGCWCELFTGHLSTRNLYLYRKLGYREIRREPISDTITLVFLGKRCKQTD